MPEVFKHTLLVCNTTFPVFTVNGSLLMFSFESLWSWQVLAGLGVIDALLLRLIVLFSTITVL